MVKHLPTMRETRVQSLGREDLLEKEMATHSSILGWKILWTEEPGKLQYKRSQRVRHDWATSRSFHFQGKERKGGRSGDVLKRFITVLLIKWKNLNMIK